MGLSCDTRLSRPAVAVEWVGCFALFAFAAERQYRQPDMIVGSPATFAIESGIAAAYEEPSQMALGFFLIHIAGKSYGVRASDASLLACSFGEVVRRVGYRGKHTAPFSGAEAFAVARSFREAIYQMTTPTVSAVGISSLEFEETVRSNHIVWAPDGDEAFDDGSYVLQFDTREGVRLIGFKTIDSGLPDEATLSDVKLRSEDFYSVLVQWHESFEEERRQILRTRSGAV